MDGMSIWIKIADHSRWFSTPYSKMWVHIFKLYMPRKFQKIFCLGRYVIIMMVMRKPATGAFEAPIMLQSYRKNFRPIWFLQYWQLAFLITSPQCSPVSLVGDWAFGSAWNSCSWVLSFLNIPWWLNMVAFQRNAVWSMNGRIPKMNSQGTTSEAGCQSILSPIIHRDSFCSMFQRSVFEGTFSGDRFPTTCRCFAHVPIQQFLFSFSSVLLVVSCRCNKDEFELYNRQKNSMVSQLQNSMGFFRIPKNKTGEFLV